MAAFPFNTRLPTPAGYGSLQKDARAGFQDVLGQFKHFMSLMQGTIMPEAMLEALRPTLELSQKYVPYATGELHDSAYVEIVEKGRSSTKVEIGYGKDGQAPYALFVHEMPHYHTPPTRYKFLEVAIDEDSRNLLDRIAGSIKAKVGL